MIDRFYYFNISPHDGNQSLCNTSSRSKFPLKEDFIYDNLYFLIRPTDTGEVTEDI